MTARITVAHNEARLAGTLAHLDEGAGNASIQIFGGTKPPSIGDTPDSAMLVQIGLTKPAGTIEAGVLSLTADGDGLVTASGFATWARFVNGNGNTVMDGDCSASGGGGDVTLVTQQLYAGGDARLVSALIG